MRAAATITDRIDRARVLAAGAKAVAAADPMWAVEIAVTITDPYSRSWELAELAAVAVTDPVRAGQDRRPSGRKSLPPSPTPRTRRGS